MNLASTLLHLPFLLAQADTPDSSPIFTVNGQPATPEQVAAMKSAGMVGGIIGLLIAVVALIALWKIYTKAGKPGWASIIPIYNTVVLLEIVGRPVWWIILLLIPFVNIVVAFIVLYDLCKSFGYGVGFLLGMIFLSPIFLLILAFGSARYVGPAGRPGGVYPGGLPPGYPPATV